MNGILLGAFGALVLATIALFWMQGRAQVEEAAPPPEPGEEVAADSDALPQVDASGMRGPAPPEASELSLEQPRFFRYDRDRDLKITRNEMLSTRTAAFRRLDTDGNNLLTFEEWAISTSNRFDGMDADGDDELTPAEFATSRPSPRSTQSCSC